jgi:hypothetical protein
MTLLDQIQRQLRQLPPEKQREVLDFVTFLQVQTSPQTKKRKRSLQKHPAFGSWRERKIDALVYEQNLRAEWDARP